MQKIDALGKLTGGIAHALNCQLSLDDGMHMLVKPFQISERLVKVRDALAEARSAGADRAEC